MKVPLSWLKEFVDIKYKPEELAERLMMAGTEIKSIHRPNEFPGIFIGHVLSVRAHPNADSLKLADVSTGKKTLKIVCGAMNLKEGQRVPVATVGAVLPDGLKIEARKIRGEMSMGMICSEAELGLSEESEGIMVLPQESKVGARFDSLMGGDTILEADVTTNRGDELSILGIAREVAALDYKKPKSIKYPVSSIRESKVPVSKFIKVDVRNSELCSQYAVRVVKVKKIIESPKWMQERLIACGVRPINAVVDVTNYVMLELGQPMHAFDYSKISGKKIIVRESKDGEKITTLDGVARVLKKGTLVIADTLKPIAVAGVIGGANSAVVDSTRVIVLESAEFDPTSVRKTAQALGVRTEAVSRFEKKIDYELPQKALERAAHLLQKITGAEILADSIYHGPSTPWIQRAGVSVKELNSRLGTNLTVNEAIGTLTALGFEANKFDVVAEVKKHLGKPYLRGASFRKNGTDAFDCSYLTDYLFSLVGVWIGHDAISQYFSPLITRVGSNQLQPGDLLFGKGSRPKKMPGKNEEVGHVGVYVGNDQVVHASSREGRVVSSPHGEFKKNLGKFHGVCRFIEDSESWISVVVPSYRRDVKISEDLIEEVARIYGYDKIPSKLPAGMTRILKPDAEYVFDTKIKNWLAGYGLNQVISYSFVSGTQIEKVGLDKKQAVRVINPLSEEHEYMRPNLLPSLLHLTGSNLRFVDSLSIFELAHVYAKLGRDKTAERRELTVVKTGEESFKYLKGVATAMLKKLGLSAEFLSANGSPFSSGAVSEIRTNSIPLGILGDVKQETLGLFDIEQKVSALIIDSNLLQQLSEQAQTSFRELPKVPPVKRDISFFVNENVAYGDVIRSIMEVSNITEVILIEVYRGKPVPHGKKSIALGLSFRSDKTLTDKEADIEFSKIEHALSMLGAIVRK